MHRRQIRTWLFSVLFFSALSVTAFAEQAIVTGEEVNVRSGPGLVYSSFTSLREGMTVEVLNRSNADWYQVSWDGNVGYVSSAYLRLAEDTAPAGYDAAGQSSPGYINAMYVSLRSGPGTGYSVLGTYSNGKELTIRGSSGEWTAVTVDGKDGFVYHDYVSAERDHCDWKQHRYGRCESSGTRCQSHGVLSSGGRGHRFRRVARDAGHRRSGRLL